MEANSYRRQKPSLLPCRTSNLPFAEKGFTLLEILVATSIGAMVLGLAFTYYINISKLSSNDSSRVAASQNAQGAIDMLSNDLRQAGENLDFGLGISGVEIDNALQQIIVRSNISIASRTLIPRLPLCSVSGNTIQVNGPPPTSTVSTAACTYSDGDSNNDDDNVQRWRSYFDSKSNQPQAAILYRPASSTLPSAVAKAVVLSVNPRLTTTTSAGSFYRTSITLNSIVSSDFSAANNSQIILVDERRYKKLGDTLILALGGQTDSQAQVVAFNVQTLNASADLLNPTANVTSIGLNGPWSRIKNINITLGSKSPNSTILGSAQKSYTASIYPRNVASSPTNLTTP
ncbi:PilW family protein [Deinococcus hopiensis]|uniref:Prepilin-type N-terminal cleavage/methylation domain-containing protein n=1 Tax=Deinococcus hopiensis KR-140 TaxID=695939 RepID=A0A1W1VQQ4_9DEIO|nr:prepilin-type N-terminal cleavage/methylation domain-containing protein [Deinococcus hopiensis]SMB95677.1 prepilin-type N-terminal cleavage/methylation domain-containing protein [Deinococcus hopiensis KR-140]